MAELDGAEFVNLFAAPFMSYRWPEADALNKDLRQRIFAYEREHPGRENIRSSVGGWRTEGGMIPFCGEPGKIVIARMVEMVNEATRRVLDGRQFPAFTWTLEAWANVNRTGDFNRMHIHGMSTWSGTYYVDDGDPPTDEEHGTALELADPCSQRSVTFFPAILPGGLYVRPLPGLMVLFPSYVPHMVMPHRGKRPRISIGFNFRKTPFP